MVQNYMNKEQDHVAQKKQVLLIDDLSGDDAQETVKFALDGAQYEIDLTTEHAAELREKLSPYLSSGRRLRGGAANRGARRETAPRSDDSRKIREWAIANGFKPSARGRISQEIREAYSAAQ
ncbi:Lsr2 family protein [Arthrobacter citreus]|uniref:Lsr2 family protein n=1 Tax=Arthrobacter citreus TaxID=1670 RepID=A0ABZ3A140_9MICC